MNRFSLLIFGLLCFNIVQAQSTDSAKDSAFIAQIFRQSLTHSDAYPWLRGLCKDVGHRISGSAAAAKAVTHMKAIMDTMKLDRVELQPCIVPAWVRGDKEVVQILDRRGKVSRQCRALSLGGTIATSANGINAEVIEVDGLATLDKMDSNAVKGKIVFFNRHMDAGLIYTMNAYGGCVDQRGQGPAHSSVLGAAAVIVRSMNPEIDTFAHTGNTNFREGINRLPALAISTEDADYLSAQMKEGKVRIFCQSSANIQPDVLSYNVIGEIKGSEKPEEIILIGGHLDSWDVGEGAHDDGAGCVHSMAVLQVLKALNYRPKRTIRCVLFMNEENGLRGGLAYADSSKARGEQPLVAIESDRGGFTPRGFTIEGGEESQAKYKLQFDRIRSELENYDLKIKSGGGGSDIGPLKSQGAMLIGFEPDNQRYFDFHHTKADVFEMVDKRELDTGTASIAALVYLLDKYGLK
ncbi:MAG: M28 family peptidase [Saprospiraceae bacterium]